MISRGPGEPIRNGTRALGVMPEECQRALGKRRESAVPVEITSLARALHYSDL